MVTYNQGETNHECHLWFGKHKNYLCICAVIIFQFPLIQVIYEFFSVAGMGLSTAPRKMWL